MSKSKAKKRQGVAECDLTRREERQGLNIDGDVYLTKLVRRFRWKATRECGHVKWIAIAASRNTTRPVTALCDVCEVGS